jgi:hypothetical protein
MSILAGPIPGKRKTLSENLVDGTEECMYYRETLSEVVASGFIGDLLWDRSALPGSG